MSRLFSALYIYRQATALFLTITLSIALLSLTPHQQTRLSRIAMMTVLSPVQETFSFIPSFFNLKQENRLLREELVRMQLELAAQRESIRENHRLRQLLGFKKNKAFAYMPAEVIAHDPGREMHAVVIDIGKLDGVQPYMAVVTAQGLVGRVIDAGPISSKVQLLTDRNCRISSIVQRSRVKGIVSWRYSNALELRLPVHADVRIGDTIVSSGLGGTVPPGLVIGRVVRVRLEAMGLFKQVVIQPRVDLNRLEEVFVIHPQPEARMEQTASTD